MLLDIVLYAADSILERTLRGALAGAIVGAIAGPLVWLAIKAQQRWGSKPDQKDPPPSA